MPLFFDETATLFDFLPEDALLCLHQDIKPVIDDFWRDTQSRYKLLRGDKERPPLPPNELFLTSDLFFGQLKPYARIEIHSTVPNSKAEKIKTTSLLPAIQVERQAENPLEKFTAFVDEFTASGGRVLLLAESIGRRELISEYLNRYKLHPENCADYAEFQVGKQAFVLGVSPLHNGFILNDERIAFVTEAELYATHLHGRRERESRKATSTDAILRDLSEIKTGDPVVHEQHGIGRYKA